jgi:hypothetical protein
MSRPAEPERHDPHVGMSHPDQSTWDWEKPYLGPPEEGQPRAGSAHRISDARSDAPRPAVRSEPTRTLAKAPQ